MSTLLSRTALNIFTLALFLGAVLSTDSCSSNGKAACTSSSSCSWCRHDELTGSCVSSAFTAEANYTPCVELIGDLRIVSTQLADLVPLSALVNVTGKLLIEDNTLLTSLSGLDSLRRLGSLSIQRNAALVHLTGLNAVDAVTTVPSGWSPPPSVHVQSNPRLESMNILSTVRLLPGELRLFDNPRVTNYLGFTNLESVGGYLTVQGTNEASLLTSVEFPRLQNVSGYIRLWFLPNVTTVSFPLLTRAGRLDLKECNGLSSLAGFPGLRVLGPMTGSEASWLPAAFALTSCKDLEDLTGLHPDIGFQPGSDQQHEIVLQDLPRFSNFNGFASQRTLSYLSFTKMPALTRVDGLNNLQNLTYATRNSGVVLNIETAALPDVEFLHTVEHMTGAINIISNTQLTTLSGLRNCLALEGPERAIKLEGNTLLSTLGGAFSQQTALVKLTISGSANLVALPELSHLRVLSGDLRLNGLGLSDTSLAEAFGALERLEVQGSYASLSLVGLNQLTTLSGFASLRPVFSHLYLTDMLGLKDTAFPSFPTAEDSYGMMFVEFNNVPLLTDITGLRGLNSTGYLGLKTTKLTAASFATWRLKELGDLILENNANLDSLSFLDRTGLKPKYEPQLYVVNNPRLHSFSFALPQHLNLSNIRVDRNPMLNDTAGFTSHVTGANWILVQSNTQLPVLNFSALSHVLGFAANFEAISNNNLRMIIAPRLRVVQKVLRVAYNHKIVAFDFPWLAQVGGLWLDSQSRASLNFPFLNKTTSFEGINLPNICCGRVHRFLDSLGAVGTAYKPSALCSHGPCDRCEPALQAPSHGTFQAAYNESYGAPPQAITCDSGYIAQGSAPVCQKNGTWSGPVQSCGPAPAVSSSSSSTAAAPSSSSSASSSTAASSTGDSSSQTSSTAATPSATSSEEQSSSSSSSSTGGSSSSSSSTAGNAAVEVSEPIRNYEPAALTALLATPLPPGALRTSLALNNYTENLDLVALTDSLLSIMQLPAGRLAVRGVSSDGSAPLLIFDILPDANNPAAVSPSGAYARLEAAKDRLPGDVQQEKQYVLFPSDGNLTTYIIVGAVLGGVVLIGVGISIGCCMMKRQRARVRKYQPREKTERPIRAKDKDSSAPSTASNEVTASQGPAPIINVHVHQHTIAVHLPGDSTDAGEMTEEQELEVVDLDHMGHMPDAAHS